MFQAPSRAGAASLLRALEGSLAHSRWVWPLLRRSRKWRVLGRQSPNLEQTFQGFLFENRMCNIRQAASLLGGTSSRKGKARVLGVGLPDLGIPETTEQ